MHRRLLFVAAIALLFTAAFAQRKPAKDKTPAKPLTGPAKPVMEVAIGRSSNWSGGAISKSEFDAIAPQGMRIKNPQGAFIEGFSFTYGERNLYEDSMANEKLGNRLSD